MRQNSFGWFRELISFLRPHRCCKNFGSLKEHKIEGFLHILRGSAWHKDGVWRPVRHGGEHGTFPDHTRDPALRASAYDGQPEPAAELCGRCASSPLQRALKRVCVGSERRGEAASLGAAGPRGEAVEVPALRRSTVAPAGQERELSRVGGGLLSLEANER